MMKILVTGASGNVGHFVIEELLNMGEHVVAAGTNVNKLKGRFKGKVDTVYFDITNQNTYDMALKDVDRVFLMRPPHLGKPEDLYPFIDAMKVRDIKLVSFLSLMGVENNPIPPHHKIEKYIEASGLPYAHIRPGFFMQNLSGIHSADIGLATAILLHHPDQYRNTSHTITGPEALDYNQIAAILSEVTGRQITYAKPGYWKYRKYYIKKRGLEKGYVNVTVALYFMTRMGTAKKVTEDFLKLSGRNPRTFEEFARENIRCFLNKETI